MEELIAKKGSFSLLPADEQVQTSVDSMIIKQDIYPNTGFITKRNYNQYGQVESVQIKEEIHTVFKNRIILNQYPSSYYRVNIKGFTEILTNQTLVGNQYRVAYDSGIVFFPPEFEGQSITINEYYGIGVQMIPTSRIYIGTDSDGNITNTLYDMIKVGTNSIVALEEVGGVLADGKATAERLETDTANAVSINSKILTDIDIANSTNQMLLNTISNGDTTINNLNTAQETANKVGVEVEKSITEGKLANSNLYGNIIIAEDKIAEINNDTQNLTNMVTNAKTLSKTLSTEISTGTELNSSLQNNISIGNNLNSELAKNISDSQSASIVNQVSTLEGALNSCETNATELNNKVQTLGQELAKNVLNIQENTNDLNKLTSQIDGTEVTNTTTNTSNLLTNSYFGQNGVTSSSTSGFCNETVNLVKGQEYTIAVSSCIDNTGTSNGNCVWTQVTSPNDPNTVWVGGVQNLTATVSTKTFTAGCTGVYTISTEYSVTTAGGSCTVYWYYLKQGSSISASEIQSFTNNATTSKKVKGIAQIVAQNVLEVEKNSKGIQSNAKQNKSIANYLNNSIYSSTNLFANSNFGANGSTGNGSPLSTPNTNSTLINLQKGKTYTFTGMACLNEAGNGNEVWIDLFSSDWTDNPLLSFCSTTPMIKSITFTAKTDEVYKVQLYTVPASNSSLLGTFYWYSLVEGDKPHYWSLSSQDSFVQNNAQYTAGLIQAKDTLLSHFCNTGLYYTNQTAGTSNLEDCPQKVAGYLDVYNCECDYWGVGSAGTGGIIYQTWTTYSNDVYTRVYLGYEQKWSPWNQLNSNTTATGFAVRLNSIGNSICELALQNNQLKQQNQGIGKQVVGLDLDVTGLKDRNQGLGEQVVELTLQNNQLKQQNKDLGKQVVGLDLNSMEYQTKSNTLGQQLVNLTLKNVSLEQQNEKLGQQLVKITLGNQKMQEQMGELAKTIITMQLEDNKK